MRPALIAIVVAALLIAGAFFYTQSRPHTNMMAPPATATAQAPEGAAACTAERARYRLRGDPRLNMQFETDPSQGSGMHISGSGMLTQVHPLFLVLNIPVKQEEHHFATRGVTEGYQHNEITPRAASGHAASGPALGIYLFDDEYNSIPGIPSPGDAAPAHIFSPELTRYIYNLGGDRRVDAPIAFFDYQTCAAATTP